LAVLASEITECHACSRLVRWREKVAKEKRRAYLDWDYWGRPVPGFGDPDAQLVIVGLAPGAHGANRTGRAFTGDRSGDFLYAALHRTGFANQPTSTSRDDGLTLTGVRISMPVRCAPPDNAPTPAEIERCARWFHAELALLPRARIFLALGQLAWNAVLTWHAQVHAAPSDGRAPRPKFAHGAVVSLDTHRSLLGSYHVSQQNTQTGRLTPAMFDRVLQEARARLAGRR